jgi:ATP-dependent Lhr-like helicase
MRLDHVSPLAVPALIEEGREWVAGGAEDALLAEAAALVEEVTGGEEIFAETLADVTEGVRVRAGVVDKPRHAGKGVHSQDDKRQRPRRSRFIRSAPKSVTGA